MNAAHTKPPYILSEENPCEIYPQNGGHIVAISTLPFDAGFIVKACNNHQSMVDALNLIAAQAIGKDSCTEQAIVWIKELAKEVLAKAA